jgi:hypothetical protein
VLRDRLRAALELAAIVAWVAPVLVVMSLVAGEPVGPTAVGGKGVRRG